MFDYNFIIPGIMTINNAQVTFVQKVLRHKIKAISSVNNSNNKMRRCCSVSDN